IFAIRPMHGEAELRAKQRPHRPSNRPDAHRRLRFHEEDEMRHQQARQLGASIAAAAGATLLGLYAAKIASVPAIGVFAQSLPTQSAQRLAPITLDYPEDGSIFPPEITPPTFLWYDASTAASAWTIDVGFSYGSTGLHATSAG